MYGVTYFSRCGKQELFFKCEDKAKQYKDLLSAELICSAGPWLSTCTCAKVDGKYYALRSISVAEGTSAERELVLDKCVRGVQKLRLFSEYPDDKFPDNDEWSVDGIDMDALATWYGALPSETKRQMDGDDAYTRAVLGYDNACMDFAAKIGMPAEAS